MVSAAKIALFLEELNFPADKKQIIDYARENNAPEDVLDILQKMPEGKYYSMAGVLDSISKVA